MRILIACEFSGIVREAFAKKGWDAWSCDLLPTEIPSEKHIQDDVLKHLEDGWDMMIAHPPCTYLSNAGARFLYPKGKLNIERYQKGIVAKEFFLRLLEAPINKICVENPVSSRVFEMPLFSQEIQPFQFGHPFTKKTRLWLKNLPRLVSTNIVYAGIKSLLPSNTGGKKKGQKFQFESTKIAGNWFNKGGNQRQLNRSKTFKGVAEAMAHQWGTLNGGDKLGIPPNSKELGILPTIL